PDPAGGGAHRPGGAAPGPAPRPAHRRRRCARALACLLAAPGGPAAAAVPAVAARAERADGERGKQHGDDERDHRVPGTEHGGRQDPADDGGRNPDEDRQDDPDVLTPGYDQARYRADHKSDEDPPEDDGKRDDHDFSYWLITVGFVASASFVIDVLDDLRLTDRPHLGGEVTGRGARVDVAGRLRAAQRARRGQARLNPGGGR